MSRRAFLTTGAAGVTSVWVGCGTYPAAEGVAFEPWDLDAHASDPPHLRAVRAAILAASPHNTQPWTFTASPERIELFADETRALGPMDPLGRELQIGLGCALENLVLTAEHLGRKTAVTLNPDGASVALSDGGTEDPLVHAIPARHTNRGRYAATPLTSTAEEALRGQIGDPNVTLTLLTDPRDMATFAEGTIAATEAIVADTEMNEASHAWYRHSKSEIEEHRDGTTLDATGQGAAIRFLGKAAGRPDAKTAGDYWLASTRGDQTTASAFAVLATDPRDDRIQQLRVGRAFQRLHLFATQEGLAIQPLNQMAECQDREQSLGLEPTFTNRLSALLGGGRGAQMLFRIGHAWGEAIASPRRPLEWVVS